MVHIEVSLPEHVEEGSPDWHSALESIELSLGLGGASALAWVVFPTHGILVEPVLRADDQ